MKTLTQAHHWLRLKTAMAVLLASALAGCATLGKEYPQQNIANIRVGQSTTSDVTQWFGASAKHSTQTIRKDFADHELPNPVIVLVNNYFFGDPFDSNGVLPDVKPRRWLNVVSTDGRVVGYYSGSSFKADSTDFDPAKAGAFVKGKTRESDIVAVLGQPSGRGIYPLTASSKGRALFYLIDLHNYPVGSVTKKRAYFYLDESGTLEDLWVDSRSEVIPVAPAPTVIPVYIPAPRAK